MNGIEFDECMQYCDVLQSLRDDLLDLQSRMDFRVGEKWSQQLQDETANIGIAFHHAVRARKALEAAMERKPPIEANIVNAALGLQPD